MVSFGGLDYSLPVPREFSFLLIRQKKRSLACCFFSALIDNGIRGDKVL